MAKIRGKYALVSDFSILRGGKMSVYTTRRKQMIQCYKLIDLLIQRGCHLFSIMPTAKKSV